MTKILKKVKPVSPLRWEDSLDPRLDIYDMNFTSWEPNGVKEV